MCVGGEHWCPSQVEATRLQPNTKYFYQFRYRQDARTIMYSNIGRTRTLPRANDDISRAKIAVFGCSNLVRNVQGIPGRSTFVGLIVVLICCADLASRSQLRRLLKGIFVWCSQPVAYFTAYGQIARDAERGNIDYNIHTGGDSCRPLFAFGHVQTSEACGSSRNAICFAMPTSCDCEAVASKYLIIL